MLHHRSLPTGLLLLTLIGCARNNDAGNQTNPPDGSAAGAKLAINPKPGAPETNQSVSQNTGLVLVKGDGSLGEADYGEKRATAFTVKNATGKAVSLELAEKSCACAAVEIKPTELAPDASAIITLTWVPKIEQIEEIGAMKVKVTATLQVRDQPREQIRLEAVGRIVPALYVHLPRGRLDFGRVDLGQLKTGKKELAAVVYTTDPKRKGFSLEAKSSSPGIKLVPPIPERLAAGDLQALKAVDGYRVNFRVAEGLPIGSFREIVRLKSDVYENRDLEISVEGFVETGAVSIQPTEVLNLPEKIALKSGYKCPPLTVTLQFEPNRTLTLESVEPLFLQVKLTHVRDNTWRIDVEVPAGADALLQHLKPEALEEYVVSGFDAGMITFKTNHSLVPVLKIPVPASQFRR